ncbi:MOSC domain-containing protein [Paenibacillus rigui]|uniref:MOSC domain-containing protein n=1 Tax=Paenibacillus rigui TaxID=554312 RepID=A0A229UJ13_9BACL|nr:MOSC domain-containing protein [Paenibacillus rigui]OXM83363.1 MOSC domain-containing protein [Paenibacillus rigui]
MQLLSLNVAMPVEIQYQGKPLSTGIYKKAVEGAVYLSTVQLAGDGQADLVNHGGPDKAVCVYPSEHYSSWEERLERDLEFGTFGENFTVSGLTETQVHIGDIFELGEALLQVSQPRQPCFKLGKKLELAEMPFWVQQTGHTGYYFRVLKEGHVESGQQFRLVEQDAAGITVAEANRLKYHDKSDWEGIRSLLKVEALSESWRDSFQKRLDAVEKG